MRPLFLSIPALLVLSLVHPVSAEPHDEVPGSFTFYDSKLDGAPEDPDNDAGGGQAEMVECQGKSEVKSWGPEPHQAHCLTFTPNKVGDSISFKIHIAKVLYDQMPYTVRTSGAYFGNEGVYQVLVDDQPVGEERDCTRTDDWMQGKFSIAPGDYKITYRYVKPSPKSGESSLNLVFLSFSVE